MRRADKNRKKSNFKNKYIEEIKILFAIGILLFASIIYAVFTKPKIGNNPQENIVVNAEAEVKETEFEESKVKETEARDIVKISGIKESIKTLNNISKYVIEENQDIKISIKEMDNNIELIESLISGENDIIIISRTLNDKEKKIMEENNVIAEKLMFGYLTKTDNKKVYCYVNLNKYYNNLSIREFLKAYNKKNEVFIEKSDISKLPKNIYEETLEYLNLLEVYKKE
ncbi:hypothetical protein I3900191A7_25160 [Clostridium baratii]|uniref:hypothetical protein n=1 Tax=Clostridium baratii TaxID=1561 RepID=UPI001C035302|nr:hypothetical protein [Clostridium baratii]MBT9830482.1 hypothetical protein [Clostridium baratii]MDU1854506.1 hypothetical protein [Clostridium baratii]